MGEFYSVALTRNLQQADTGTKMIHIGRNTRSTIVSKGISAGRGQNAYRGLVKVLNRADSARNYSQCDSLLIGDQCGAHTVPYIEAKNSTAQFEHEATTSKISDDQLFYCLQRGIPEEEAIALANDSEFGLCSSIWSQDAERAVALARRIEAGYTYLNGHGPMAQDGRGPFGGFKQSGYGRENGWEGMRSFMQTKSVWLSTKPNQPDPFATS